MNIQRYSVDPYEPDMPGMVTDSSGDYVKFADHLASLASERARYNDVEKLLREAADALGYLDEFYDEANGGPVTPQNESPAQLADRILSAILHTKGHEALGGDCPNCGCHSVHYPLSASRSLKP